MSREDPPEEISQTAEQAQNPGISEYVEMARWEDEYTRQL